MKKVWLIFCLLTSSASRKPCSCFRLAEFYLSSSYFEFFVCFLESNFVSQHYSNIHAENSILHIIFYFISTKQCLGLCLSPSALECSDCCLATEMRYLKQNIVILFLFCLWDYLRSTQILLNHRRIYNFTHKNFVWHHLSQIRAHFNSV